MAATLTCPIESGDRAGSRPTPSAWWLPFQAPLSIRTDAAPSQRNFCSGSLPPNSVMPVPRWSIAGSAAGRGAARASPCEFSPSPMVMRGWPIDANSGCHSSTNDYSETPGRLHRAARGTLQFLDLAAPEETRATLYHVSLATTLKLIGAENSAAFEVSPLVESTQSRRHRRGTGADHLKNRFVVVANAASATRIALTLVTARMPARRHQSRYGRRLTANIARRRASNTM